MVLLISSLNIGYGTAQAKTSVNEPSVTLCVDRGEKVQSLGLEDPLEEEMASYSSTLAWRIPWTEEPGGLQSIFAQAKISVNEPSVTFCVDQGEKK